MHPKSALSSGSPLDLPQSEIRAISAVASASVSHIDRRHSKMTSAGAIGSDSRPDRKRPKNDQCRRDPVGAPALVG
jgi:hypothetical protein